MEKKYDLAICCMAGGYRNAFAQGVLKAFEENDIRAGAYASCSSSALIAAYAAFGKIRQLDLSLWKEGYAVSQRDGNQSGAMLHSIQLLLPEIAESLWQPTTSRLLIATSLVKTDEAKLLTQTDRAKRWGQMLLIHALHHQPEWKDRNLELRMYDTQPDYRTQLLTKDNFEEVAYATTRMLHVWNVPASIDGQAYIDGSYTCLCPAFPLAELGYKKIVCVCPDIGKIVPDLFSDEEIPSQINDAVIDFIKPGDDLKSMGVSSFTVTSEGLDKVFHHGYAKGIAYIREHTL